MYIIIFHFLSIFILTFTFRNELKQYISKNKSKNYLDILEFSNAEDFLYSINEGEYFDIVFMDLYMKKINGSQAVAKLRNNSNCPNAIVFFITSYKADISKIVDLHPYAYIYKDDYTSKLDTKLPLLFNKLEMDYNTFEFKFNRTIFRIKHKDIMYIESYRNQLTVYTTNGNYDTRTYSLTKAMETLKPMNFIQCNSSTIVNYKHIKKITSKTIEMIDGKVFTIGRKYSIDITI